jgi:hypothetical protein
MTDDSITKIEVGPDDDYFYITVSDGATVYETKADAIEEIGDKLDDDDDAFIAKTSIENGDGDDDDGVSISLDQVKWQEIIPELT